MPALHARSLLLPSGFAADVRLDVDAAGIITSVEVGAEARTGDLLLPGVVLPGMPNLHSHAFQRLLVGRTEHGSTHDDSFWTWREVMYAEAESTSAARFEAAAGLLFCEMLEAGYTSVAEFHYLHHDLAGRRFEPSEHLSRRLLEIAAEVGLGMTLLPVLYLAGGFGAPLESRQRRFAHTRVDDYLELLGRLRSAIDPDAGQVLGVAPHSLRAVPLPALQDVLHGQAKLQGKQAPIHIHISEQPAEVEACLQHHGRRPLQLLFESFEVDARWCLVHATHADAAERAGIVKAGAVVGLCPSTEANLGDGRFPTRAFVEAGGRFGVGSDSQVTVDPAEELRMVDRQTRLAAQRRAVWAVDGQPPRPGLTLWARAARAGAQALGQPMGEVAVGARADLVELDPDHPRWMTSSPEETLDAFLLGSAPGGIRQVLTGGRSVVKGGRHPQREAWQSRLSRAAAERA